MKIINLTLSLLALPLLSLADVQPSVSYQCSTPTAGSQISLGSARILKIKSLTIPDAKTPDDYKVEMVLDGVTAEDAINGQNKPKQTVEVLKLKEPKTGTMYELQSEEGSKFKFDAVFLEYGDLNVETIGPVPPGVFDLKISMAFIKSNILLNSPSPMTVKKVVFNCKATIVYK